MSKQHQGAKGTAAEPSFLSYLLGGTAWFITIIMSSVSVDAIADTFIFESGEVLEGSIIRTTNHTVIVRRAVTGGIRQVGRSTIREIRVDTRSGEPVVGRFGGWSEGVYEVHSGQEFIRVRDGQILSTEAMNIKRDAETATSETGGTTKDSESSATKPDAEAAVVRPVVAAGRPQGGAGLRIEGFGTPAVESESALTFEVKLSRPAEDPVVILFSTLDGTAVAGQDYQQHQGVVTVEAGRISGRLDVRLINDQLAEPDEHFSLFLSVDPKIAELSARHITTTIKDDD